MPGNEPIPPIPFVASPLLKIGQIWPVSVGKWGTERLL